MSFIDAFLNVLAILGIIIAGGFLVFFLGDLLLSVLEPKHKKNENNYSSDLKEEKTFEKDYNNENTQTFSMEDEPAQISEEKFTMDEDEVKPVDFDEAEKEQGTLAVAKSTTTQVDEKKDDINNLFNEDEDFNFDDNFDFDKLFDEDNKETKPETVEAIAQNDILPILPASNEVKNNLVEENELKEQIEELKKELQEQKALYDELKRQAKNNEEKWEIEKANLEELYKTAEVQIEEKEKPKALLTLEEYVSRLNVLRERLRENEKELKTNKKEFLPLKRVRKNLDKDKEKLRRREALVAKQKVMLYGVNNISEINQEKAKKLAEDLDLLDGLKVSVRHCEEVMEANKDRYPILETANRILLTANKEIKDDINECEEAIRKLKTDSGDAEGAELLINSAINTINNSNTNEVLVTADGEIEAPKRRRGRPKKVESEETKDIKETKEIINTIANKVEEAPSGKTELEISNEHLKLFEEETSTAEEHKFNFDEEPTFEELMAIENEENGNKNK